MKPLANLLPLAALLSVLGGVAVLAQEPLAVQAEPQSAQQPAEAVPFKPDLARAAALVAETCVQCHNADGNSTVPSYPKIAGQHAEYAFKQLQDFKSGVRADPIMQGFASMLSEDDMRHLSHWAAGQRQSDGYASDPELVALGERIYRGGIADRQIAACAGCHSPSGAGIPVQYPRLAGQNAEYTAIQLTAFRDGTRENSVQMMQVAAKMNDREIRAVADYIAGLRSTGQP